MTLRTEARPHQRALLVALERSGEYWQESLAELTRLAETARVEVVGTVLQKRDAPDPVYFLGKGKAHEIRQIKGELGADVLLVDGDLRPTQQRNLEEAANIGVLDRTGLILDIFAQRARSGEGKIQVELAQLSYLLPRLTGKGTELSRLGGGIGTRGPGETKLEADRRRLRQRLRLLRKQVEQIAKRRSVERKHRQEAGLPVVALVGYTNAGKSTLLNTLSGAGVFVEDLLFATLDPTIRRLDLPGGERALLVDTVGFIHRLPHQLVEAFKSTLEEVRRAELLLHVVDATNPEAEQQIAIVERVLDEIGAGATPTILAWNKIDRAGGMPPREISDHPPIVGVASISAATGAGIGELLATIEGWLDRERVRIEVTIPPRRGDLLAWLHRSAKVVSERYEDGAAVVTALVTPKMAGQLRKRLTETVC